MIPDCCGRARSPGRIPGQDTCQENFAGSNVKRTASAEEEKGQRDSAASARFSWLSAASSYLFLSSYRHPPLFSFYHALWSVVKSNKSKSGGNGSFTGRYSEETRESKIVDRESRAFLITSFHPAAAFLPFFSPANDRLRTNESTCLSSLSVLAHTSVCSFSVIPLNLLSSWSLACIYPSVFPHADVRAQALLYLLCPRVSIVPHLHFHRH